MTFIQACKHISNFSSSHESRCGLLAEARLDYPENHIEAGNRLSWFLGRLDKQYGNSAFYVHLKRNVNDTATSFVRRYAIGIINAYRKSVYMGLSNTASPMTVSLDYCETINSNIELFLKDKTGKMEFNLENARVDFQTFWRLIGAEGDVGASLREFATTYNASQSRAGLRGVQTYFVWILKKCVRIFVKFPNFIRNA